MCILENNAFSFSIVEYLVVNSREFFLNCMLLLYFFELYAFIILTSTLVINFYSCTRYKITL